jgi:UDP-3-O-[3-hydroxymyristoyl] glucosamine N-acyltransferase
MKNIIIIGTGAHAAEIEQYIYDNNSIKNDYKILGYISDSHESYLKYNFRHDFLGSDINKDTLSSNTGLIIAISNIQVRINLLKKYKNEGFEFINFIHHTSKIFNTTKFGEGNVVCPYCQIGPNVEIGSYNTFNNKASIGHDSKIGDNNVFCPNIGLSGNTQIENNNFFSLNVATIPNIKIGSNNLIAPNMVIDKSIKSNITYFHRYKETIIYNTN